jgi:regulator of replication initiation timing
MSINLSPRALPSYEDYQRRLHSSETLSPKKIEEEKPKDNKELDNKKKLENSEKPKANKSTSSSSSGENDCGIVQPINKKKRKIEQYKNEDKDDNFIVDERLKKRHLTRKIASAAYRKKERERLKELEEKAETLKQTAPILERLEQEKKLLQERVTKLDTEITSLRTQLQSTIRDNIHSREENRILKEAVQNHRTEKVCNTFLQLYGPTYTQDFYSLEYDEGLWSL